MHVIVNYLPVVATQKLNMQHFDRKSNLIAVVHIVSHGAVVSLIRRVPVRDFVHCLYDSCVLL